MIAFGSKGLRFSCALGRRQEVRHVCGAGSVARPPLRGGVPAIIVNRHIDAAVNEKLRCFVVRVDGALMQDACRLVRAPIRIDVGSVLQQKTRNLKLAIHARPCERVVAPAENPQSQTGNSCTPMRTRRPGRAGRSAASNEDSGARKDGGRVMLTEAPQRRLAGRIKPSTGTEQRRCGCRTRPARQYLDDGSSNRSRAEHFSCRKHRRPNDVSRA
jgi:hypothetical protein